LEVIKINMKYTLLLFLSYTISIVGFSQSGPGGVGTNDGTSTLEYWIDANNSITGSAPITSWLDLSGNSVTNTISGNPSLTSNSLNGHDVITFDAVGDVIVTNLSINESVFPNLTVIALYKPRVNSAGGVWGEDNGGWDRFILDGNTTNLNNMVSRGTNQVNNISNIYPVGTSVITTVIYQEDVVNGTNVYANNTLQSTFTSNMGPEASNIFKVGEIGANNYRFDGDIAELIVYGTNINTAQRIIIDNYLAAKYGLALTSNDIYNEDAAISGNYDYDVAGIGRVDAANLHNDSQGTGIVRINNPTNLGDDEFFIWGHDNGLAQANENTDVPAGVAGRFTRVWRASEVNAALNPINVGDLDIRFDLSNLGVINNLDLRLLIDVDNDGTFADETPIAGATNVSGNIYQFTGVDGDSLTNNRRFTIATINKITTPLPIELVSFTARPTDNKSVQLKWQTASELNNDFFTIERSINGQDWQEVSKINGAGNSSSLLSYTKIDHQPYDGLSYYRLKQTDFDGQFEYSKTVAVNNNSLNNSEIEIFPNPTKKQITITGNKSELETINIYNVLGQNVTNKTVIKKLDSKVIIDLTKLSVGTYYIRTKTTANKVYKQ
jgi:hypothetical protein